MAQGTAYRFFTAGEQAFIEPAIDRLIHHAVILELTGTSVRADAAEGALKEARTTTTTGTTTTTPGQESNEVHGEI